MLLQQLLNYLLLKQTATTVVEPIDGTSFSVYTSGGDVKTHNDSFK